VKEPGDEISEPHTDPQEFTLVLKYLDNKTRGNTQTTKYPTEPELQAALKETMSELELDDLFKRAKPAQKPFS
jgi:hypothetical protein